VPNREPDPAYLTHAVDGRAYLYSPVESRYSLAARAVRQIIDEADLRMVRA
jgi:hypothetical protein